MKSRISYDFFPISGIEYFCIIELLGENIVTFEYTQQTQEIILREGANSLRKCFGHYDAVFVVETSKSWIKRYCVFYQTSQGYFFTFYSDYTEFPPYSQEPTHHN